MNEPVKFLSDFKSDFEISVVKKKLKHEVASPANTHSASPFKHSIKLFLKNQRNNPFDSV